jgi:hypothetical protein
MVIALSGRRIDAVDAKEPRFPLANVDLVRLRIRSMLKAQAARVLVSSAACGADLIALLEADSLGLTSRIVLPSTREHFKRRSVADRPGDWGAIYDKVMDAASANGNLVLMNQTSPKPDYFLGSQAILGEAVTFAKKLGTAAGAVLVWNGISRGNHDVTEEFGEEARKRGLPVVEISTL